MAPRQADPTPHGSEPAGAEQPAASHALVALTPTADMHLSPETYRQAPFLAQLLAIKDQHPQTRARRRAEPDEALAAYRATAALTRFG
ncbi:MAG: hypothetical protein ABSF41_01995 [Pseudolabrys sp.]